MSKSKEDPRVTRARLAGLEHEGVAAALDPDFGQKDLQARADTVAEIGYFPDEIGAAVLEETPKSKDSKSDDEG